MKFLLIVIALLLLSCAAQTSWMTRSTNIASPECSPTKITGSEKISSQYGDRYRWIAICEDESERVCEGYESKTLLLRCSR